MPNSLSTRRGEAPSVDPRGFENPWGLEAENAAVPLAKGLSNRGFGKGRKLDRRHALMGENRDMAVAHNLVLEGGLVDLCRRWKVTELALFGSVLRGDYGPDSDIDVLVSFAPDAHWSLFDLVRMQEELRALWGREVDLLERQAIEQSENYIRRKQILRSAEVIYAAG